MSPQRFSMEFSSNGLTANANFDPTEFVTEYLKKRNLKRSRYEDSEIERDVNRMATEASEGYKIKRTKHDESEEDSAVDNGSRRTELTCKAIKHFRRLENNRKSSGASKVYKKVHEYVTAYSISQVVAKCEQLEKDIAINVKRANILEQENKQFRDCNVYIRTLLASGVNPLAREPALLKSMGNLDSEAPLVKPETSSTCFRILAVHSDPCAFEGQD